MSITGRALDDEDWDENASPLDELVVECLQRASEIGPAALEESCKKHPELADALRERVSRLAAFGMLPESTHRAPTQLGGFRILREIGRGGMGVVYLAEQTELHRFVALKVLAPGVVFHQKALERFRREALTAAQLNHPGIVKVHAVGEDQGIHWIAMELIAGVSLEKVVEELSKLPADATDGERLQCLLQCVRSGVDTFAGDVPSEDKPKSEMKTKSAAASGIRGRTYVETVCRIAASVAETLHFAHEHGVVHRDVKPANVLLRPDLSPVLSDFGLARQESLPGLTKSGEFAGTPYYVSPEQASARSGTVKAATDIYSLGVTLYEMLTLKRPFEGQTSQEVISRVLTEEAPDPRRFRKDLAADLATILLKSLEKDPANRYANATNLAEDLRAFINFKLIRAVPPSAATRIRKFARRRPLITSILAIVVLLCIAGGVYYETLPGELYITSPIEGTTVSVDGVVRGTVGPTAPMIIKVRPGVHKLQLEKRDTELSSPEEEITVGRGERRAVERALASLRGALRLESTPPGARVTIRGADAAREPILATSPALVDLPAGKHRVTFELAGFTKQEVDAVVLAGGIVTPCSARWDTGTLALECQQTGVRVELFAGKTCTGTPVQVSSLPRVDPFILPVGEYSLRATCVEHATVTMDQSRSIAIESSKTTFRGLWLPDVNRIFEIQLQGRVYGVVNANFGISGEKSYVFGTEHGTIVAVRPDGSKVFEVECGKDLRQLIAFDWNGDGIDEVFGRLNSGIAVGYNKSGENILQSNRGMAGGGLTAALKTSQGAILVSQTLGAELYLFHHQKPVQTIRAKNAITDIQIVDLNKDGLEDLLLCTRGGNVEAWTLDETPKRFLQIQPGSSLRGVLAIQSAPHRVSGFVAFSTDDHAYFLDPQGTLVKDVILPEKMKNFQTVDLNIDGKENVLVVETRRMQTYTPQGELVTNFQTDATIDPVMEFDIDRDGHRDVVAGTVASRLHAWSANGTSLLNVDLGAGQISTLRGFVTGAGESRVLATSYKGLVVVVDHTGAPVFSSEMRGRTMDAIVTDADSDGVPEAAVGTWFGHAAILRVQDRPQFSVEVSADGFCLKAVPKGLTKTPGVLIGSVGGMLTLLDSTGHKAKEQNFRSAPLILEWRDVDSDPNLMLALANRKLVCTGPDLETIRWEATLPGQGRNMVAADLDGDGKSDTAVVTGESNYVAHNSKGDLLWDIKTQSDTHQFIASGDIDKDGKSEVAIDEGKGEITLRDASGQVVGRMAVKERVSGIRMADFNQDGKSDVLVSGGSDLVAFDGSGQEIFRVPDIKSLVHLDVGDVNNDGRLDFIGVNQAQYILVADSTGRVLAKRPESIVTLAAQLADFDADGVPDFATVDATGYVQRISMDGSRVAYFRSRDVVRAIECMDLDGDGRQDLIGSCDGSSVVIFDLATRDPRAALRILFKEGVDAAEKGNETVATEKLTKAGMSWLVFDNYGVDDFVKKLEALPNSPSAVRALAALRYALKDLAR